MLFELFVYLSIFSALLCTRFDRFIATAWDLWRLPVAFAVSFLHHILRFAVFLLIVSLFVHTDRERVHPSRFYQRLTTEASCLILRLTRTKLTISGAEKLPKGGNFLLVCNHRHYIDPVVLMAQFKDRAIGFVAKQEIRNIPIVGKLLYMCGGVFLNREDDRAALRPIRQATKELAEGQCDIGIFPEGTRNTKERLLPFRAGAFSIAKRSQKPIVVAAITETEHILRPKRTNVHIHICKVISPEEQKNLHTTQISNMAREAMLTSLEQQKVILTQ